MLVIKALQKQSYLGLPCLSWTFRQAISVQNFRIFPKTHKYEKSNKIFSPDTSLKFKDLSITEYC